MICTYDYIYMVICHWNWGIIPRIQSDNHSVLARGDVHHGFLRLKTCGIYGITMVYSW